MEHLPAESEGEIQAELLFPDSLPPGQERHLLVSPAVCKDWGD